MQARNEAIFRLTVTLDRDANFPFEGPMGCVFIDHRLPLLTENSGFALYTAFTSEAAATSGGALSANPLRLNALAQVALNVTAVVQRRNTILLQQVSNVTSTFTSGNGD